MVEPKDLLRYALEATRDRVIRCLEDLSEEEARRVVQGLSPVVWQVGHLAQADGVLLSVGEMLAFSAYHRGYHIGKMATLRALLGKPRLLG
jgi:uncharacterized damage-inducible protein DinB